MARAGELPGRRGAGRRGPLLRADDLEAWIDGHADGRGAPRSVSHPATAPAREATRRYLLASATPPRDAATTEED